MSFGIRWRLTLMMLLQYGIWGGWSVVASQSFVDLGFNGAQIGILFSLLPLATIIAPFIAGQIADRYVNTEKFLAILHLLGGVTLFVLAKQTEFSQVRNFMLLYSFFYAPTLALSNSITFHHLSSSEREFGGIRVGGTIGWILAGWILGVWRNTAGQPIPGDLFYLAGVLSIALGLLSFALPATPPKREGANPLAFLEALALLKNRNFLIFMAISFIVGTELEFYYILTAPFLAAPTALNGIGIATKDLSLVMSVAQIAEIGVMLALPFLLPKFGVRKTMVIGIIAWPIRYAIFAFLPIKALVIAALTLHGFCYVFFFVVGFIYVDQVAPKDIRASAQALVALVVLGLGRCLGSVFAGWTQNHFTSDLTTPMIVDGMKVMTQTNWQMAFAVPCALTVICAIVFPILFLEKKA